MMRITRTADLAETMQVDGREAVAGRVATLVELAEPAAPAAAITFAPFKPIIEPQPPEFPIDVLPVWLADWVRATTAACKVRPDVPASIALGVVSWAAAWSPGELMQAKWGAMDTTLNLYTCVIEESGTNKSGVFKKACAPLRAIESEVIADGESEYVRRKAALFEAEAELDAAKTAMKQAKKAKHKATSKSRSIDELRNDLEEAELKVKKAEWPTVPEIIANDATPEAITRALASTPVICIATAEGQEVFALATGRYGKGANFGAVLNAHGAESIDEARVGRRGVKIEKPLASMALATQPVTLRRLGKMDGDVIERGLAGRILWSYPTSVLGTRTPPSATCAPSPAVVEGYDAGIRMLFNTRPPTGGMLTLSEGATALADAFFEETEPELKEVGALRWCSSMVSKLQMHVLRFAGIFHLADGADPAEPISADVMTRAVALARYYLAHEIKAWRAMVNGEEPVTAKVWRRLRCRAKPLSDTGIVYTDPQNPRSGVDCEDLCTDLKGLTERDLHQRTRRIVPEMDDLRASLRPLVEAGYIAIVEQWRPPGKPGRPPSPWIVINPEALNRLDVTRCDGPG